MEFIKAALEDTEPISRLVKETIRTVYPSYYPEEVVDFFLRLHGKEHIEKDIASGCVSILMHENQLAGTGSYTGNHITRVYVSPVFLRQGFGRYIMQQLEEQISKNYDTVYLDSSLPASHFYKQMGYKTLNHQKMEVENGVVFIYEVMKKHF